MDGTHAGTAPQEAFVTAVRFGTLIWRRRTARRLGTRRPTVDYILAAPSSPAELIGFAG
jgi:hypothetical protein